MHVFPNNQPKSALNLHISTLLSHYCADSPRRPFNTTTIAVSLHRMTLKNLRCSFRIDHILFPIFFVQKNTKRCQPPQLYYEYALFAQVVKVILNVGVVINLNEVTYMCVSGQILPPMFNEQPYFRKELYFKLSRNTLFHVLIVS